MLPHTSPPTLPRPRICVAQAAASARRLEEASVRAAQEKEDALLKLKAAAEVSLAELRAAKDNEIAEVRRAAAQTEAELRRSAATALAAAAAQHNSEMVATKLKAEADAEAAVGDAEARAAAAVLAAAAVAGFAELPAPRRRVAAPDGLSTMPARIVLPTSVEDAAAAAAAVPEGYAELLEALAREAARAKASAAERGAAAAAAAADAASLRDDLAAAREACAAAEAAAAKLESERTSWLSQLEGEGGQLRSLFAEARDAKEHLLCEWVEPCEGTADHRVYLWPACRCYLRSAVTVLVCPPLPASHRSRDGIAIRRAPRTQSRPRRFRGARGTACRLHQFTWLESPATNAWRCHGAEERH